MNRVQFGGGARNGLGKAAKAIASASKCAAGKVVVACFSSCGCSQPCCFVSIGAAAFTCKKTMRKAEYSINKNEECAFLIYRKERGRRRSNCGSETGRHASWRGGSAGLNGAATGLGDGRVVMPGPGSPRSPPGRVRTMVDACASGTGHAQAGWDAGRPRDPAHVPPARDS